MRVGDVTPDPDDDGWVPWFIAGMAALLVIGYVTERLGS